MQRETNLRTGAELTIIDRCFMKQLGNTLSNWVTKALYLPIVIVIVIVIVWSDQLGGPRSQLPVAWSQLEGAQSSLGGDWSQLGGARSRPGGTDKRTDKQTDGMARQLNPAYHLSL